MDSSKSSSPSKPARKKPSSKQRNQSTSRQQAQAQHIKETPAQNASEQQHQLCWSFQKTGTCKFGPRCKFSHNVVNKKAIASASKHPPLCFSFKQSGSCKYGSQCRFSHDIHTNLPQAQPTLANKPSQPNNPPICFTFQQFGTCQYGSQCRFSHDTNTKVAQTTVARPSSSSASHDVVHFLKKVQQLSYTQSATVRLNNEHDRTLWFQSWAALSTGAELTSALALFRMLMRLPASTACIPPTTQVLKAAVNLANHLNTEKHHGRILSAFEAITDVVESRLLGRSTDASTYNNADCIDLANNIRSSVHVGLMGVIGNPKHAQRASRILCRSLALLDRYIAHLERLASARDTDAEDEEQLPWMGWRNATVGWLQRGKWINSKQLKQHYDDIEQYTDTLCQLVTKLTFFWGAGALFPKCRVQRNENNPCNQPLYVIASPQSKLLCSGKPSKGRTCTSKALWRCSRGGHDALCESCFRAVQSKLVGEPGSRASTDIYDAVVERETTRKEGVVYIASHLESRKPPSIGPNWKTTYRLSCSALVGVVRLGASHEPLNARSRIEWAEVVPVHPQSGFKDDYKERAEGRIALRLLTRSDLSTLPAEMDALPTGMRIAIIDLQVFVPEVVSVLSVLTDPSLADHLRRIPFWPELIGQGDVKEAVYDSDAEIDVSLEGSKGITISELMERLPPSRKLTLRRELDDLARASKLTGTQLTAYSEALANGLHCTQGPPGTGKSYLGVTLVRALDLIRTAAMSSGYALGPIVVLSYKNHALDEILGDLMNSQEWTGSIIRCGKTEDSRLQTCMEQKSAQERRAQYILNQRITCLRGVRRILKDMRTLRTALEDETGIALESWLSSRKAEGPEIAAVRVLQALALFCNVKQVGKQPTSEQAYNLLEQALCSRDFLTRADSMLLILETLDLHQGMEHWISTGQNRALFLIGMWLQGLDPPPRCAAAATTGCVQISARDGAYCELLHKCKYEMSCDYARLDGFSFCENHLCTWVDCARPRLANGDVCKRHACVYCVKNDRYPVKKRVGEACEEHSCRVDLCPGAFLDVSLPFCVSHCCDICKYYAKRNPENVKSVHRIEESRFCAGHKCSLQHCLDYRIQDDRPQVYCKNHACVACPDVRKLVDAAAPRSFLCVEHRCPHVELDGELCYEQKENGSIFCTAHTCRFCRAEGMPLNRPVVDYEPRNVCSVHPLCSSVSADGSTCTERVSSLSSTFCEKHINQHDFTLREEGIIMQCEGTTTKGRRCRATGISFQPVFYCLAHIGQMPEAVPEDDQRQDDRKGVEQLIPDDIEWQSSGEEDISHEVQEIGSSEQCNVKDPQASTVDGSGALHTDLGTEDLSQSQVMSKPESPVTYNVEDCKNLDVTQNHSAVGDIPQQGSIKERTQDVIKAKEDEKRASNDTKESACRDLSSEESESSVDLDAGDERLAFNVGQDEVDAMSSSSGSNEDEIADQMQHLRDIFDGGSTSASDSDESEIDLNAFCPDDNNDNAFDVSIEWKWDQSKQERWLHVAKFLSMISATIAKYAAIADGHVECARRELSETAAYSFKRARVIGATVVGAARRLNALRASEPFAMVVEEACEVLEPTLISVLAVRSLCKLELIGDHRQLPAFVQPCWFPIETSDPSIKVSLFERLVKNDSSMCSVLDIQRRMRPTICDLTRIEYDDLVTIEDHECTISQRIGDRLTDVAPAFSRERNLWVGEGITVPGLRSPVFFWDLQTQEGRAAVGLSKCNMEEASACVSLCQWLVYSGISPQCITVITPYKGQKLTIMKKLRSLHGKVNRITNINVSTVDRYQGDENDIIILSLVSTRPGNRFLALRNRFIVSASRARIGFYIVGSSKAISTNAKGGPGPSHWRRFLKDLKVCDGDGEESHLDSLDDHQNRIGCKLPISCPRHGNVTKDIGDFEEFPFTAAKLAAFCTNPCPFKLSWCGHDCQELCHSYEDTSHTKECSVLVERPCVSHADVPLRCSQVKRSDKSAAKSLAHALEEFRCEVKVQYFRPECSHPVQLSCYDHEQVLLGNLILPDCKEVVANYVHPSCGHIRQRPVCHVRRAWEETPPLCRQEVDHVRPCGCKMRMQCHQSVEEQSSDTPPLCQIAVVRPRPRCSHPLSSRCCDSGILRSLWLEQDGAGLSDISTVVYGTDYGPSETELGTMKPERLDKKFPRCLVKTEYRKSCGHTTMIPCATAFLQAKSARDESSCCDEIELRSSLCGHRIKVPCHMRRAIEDFSLSVLFDSFDESNESMERIGYEKTFLDTPKLHSVLKKVSRMCNGTFSILKKCGHRTKKIPCKELYSMLNSKILPKCETILNMKRPCGHVYKTKCHRQGEPAPKCSERNEDPYVFLSCKYRHIVRPRTCDELTLLRSLENPECKTIVTCVRARCSHTVEVPCHLEQSVTKELAGSRLDTKRGPLIVEAGVAYCDSAPGVTACNERTSYRRLCGHEKSDVPCDLAFKWASSPDTAPPCRTEVQLRSPLCQHNSKIECRLREVIGSLNPWNGIPPQHITKDADGEVPITSPVVIQDERQPVWFSELGLLKCGQTTCLRRSCGHEEDVKCGEIFAALESPCEQKVAITCNDCGHNATVPCNKVGDGSSPFMCEHVVEKRCSFCDINVVKVECYKEVAFCGRKVTAQLSCGHDISWTCGEEEVKTKQETESCLFCKWERYKEALQKARNMWNECSKKREDKEEGGNIFDGDLLMANLLRRATSALPEESLKSVSCTQELDSKTLLSAYIDVLQRQCDLVLKAMRDGCEELVVPDEVLNVSDADNCYDIICSSTKLQGETVEQHFRMVDTTHGLGVVGHPLCAKELIARWQEREEDGLLTVYVGAALRNKALYGVPPFRPSSAEIRQERLTRKTISMLKNRAGLMKMHYESLGYDHVYRNETEGNSERVYWKTGSVIPLMKIEVELHRVCGICLDETVAGKGWCCARDHFVCRECFIPMVEAARAPGSLKRSVDEEGYVRCPEDKCDSRYEPLLLLQQKHDASEEELKVMFQLLQELRMQRHTAVQLQTALDAQKRQLKAEFDRIQQIADRTERRAEELRLTVIEDILTLRCPKCKVAFFDFDGCCALTCQNKVCRVNFCAWCVEHHSYEDVHSHVIMCNPHGREAYGSMASFRKHHAKKARRLVIEKLRSEDDDVQRLALKCLARELEDLGIGITVQEVGRR